MAKEIYSIRGMHCRSCEIRIENKIAALEGVDKVSVDHKRGKAEVYYHDASPHRADIAAAVRAAGYELGEATHLPRISKDPLDYLEIAFAIGAVFLLFVILKLTGLWDAQYSYGNSVSYPLAILVGLTAGISTCMALIGGLVLGISARHAELHPEATARQKFHPHIFFNLGRLLSFALFGGLIGWLGSLFTLSSLTLGFLIVAVSLVMFWLGLKLVGIFPRLGASGLTLPKGIARFFGIKTEVKEYSHHSSLMLGVATFFLPCGFTQAMQLYAISTGSFVEGSILMFLFALGTTPGLLGIGGLTSIAKGAFGRFFFKTAGVIVIALSILNISAGLSLAGISLSTMTQGIPVPIENGVQVARMTQSSDGYSPKSMTVRKGIPVRWIIDSKSVYTCAASLVVPKLKIAKVLTLGENTIEFTPLETGRLAFSCSMGMYSGNFNVVN